MCTSHYGRCTCMHPVISVKVRFHGRHCSVFPQVPSWVLSVLHGQVQQKRNRTGQHVSTPYQCLHTETWSELLVCMLAQNDMGLCRHLFPPPPPRQCTQDEYNDSHGGKWTVDNLMLFLEGTRGREVSNNTLHCAF